MKNLSIVRISTFLAGTTEVKHENFLTVGAVRQATLDRLTTLNMHAKRTSVRYEDAVSDFGDLGGDVSVEIHDIEVVQVSLSGLEQDLGDGLLRVRIKTEELPRIGEFLETVESATNVNVIATVRVDGDTYDLLKDFRFRDE